MTALILAMVAFGFALVAVSWWRCPSADREARDRRAVLAELDRKGRRR